MKPLSQEALDQLFLKARTFNAWKKEPVSDELITRLYDLTKMGPTAANSSPMRIIFVKSKESKEKLLQAMAPGNVEKTRSAPVTAIIAQDMEFHEQLPKLFPQVDARSWYAGNKPLIEETAVRNSSLQGAYLMIAARSLGLDCGPMSGFDANKLNELFFAGTTWKANFVCNIGYGDTEGQHPRLPRLVFGDAAKIV